MACNKRCAYCNKRLLVSSITNVPGVAIILNIPQIVPQNLKRYCIDVNVQIPAPVPGTDPLIFISNGIVTVPVLNCAGNFARVSQLDCSNRTECGLRFSAIFGNDLPHFLFFNGLNTGNCCNQFGVIPLTAVTALEIADIVESLQPGNLAATLNPPTGGAG